MIVVSFEKNYMSDDCSDIKGITIDCASSINLDYIFNGCYALESVVIKNINGHATLNSAFENCTSLRRVIFENPDRWFGSDIDLSASPIDNKSAIAMFESLPNISENHTIKLGGLGLSDDEKAIATNKGWTVS